MQTNLSWGDTVLALGWPEVYQWVTDKDLIAMFFGSLDYLYEGWYEARGMYIWAGALCEHKMLRDWPVYLQYLTVPPELSPTPYAIASHCR